MSLKSQEMYEFGPYRLDATGRMLFRADRAIPLPPKQIDTLIILVRARGAVVDRETLVSQVWPETFVEEAGLTRNVSLLRKALETGDETFIETIPKRGYRFAAPVLAPSPETETLRIVERVTSISIDEEVDDGEGAPVAQVAGRSGYRWQWVGAAILVVSALASVYVWRGRSEPAAPSAQAVRSIAVLPFRHLNPDERDRPLSVGLADVLITRFANLASVVVTPTTTVLPFAGRDAIAAGKAMGVDAVLDGTIQRAPDRVRVTVQLLHVGSGRPLWAGSFDEPAAGLLAIEDAIANAVAGLLVPNLGRDERSRLARRSTTNPDAWQAYLRGRTLWATRSVNDIEESVVAFESAIRADPSFALAYAGLAQTLIIQGDYQYRWPRDVYPLAKAAALRAVELDGSLGDAHGALAAIAWEFDWDWVTAEREFERALALHPNDATLHLWRAEFLIAQARWDEGLRAADTAVQLDPTGFAPNSVRANLLFWAGNFEQSIAQAHRAMDLNGNVGVTALYASASYHAMGRTADARASLEKARASLGEIAAVKAFTARYEYLAGRRESALGIIRALERQRETSYVEPLFIAAVYADAGDANRALQWIGQMISDRSVYVPRLAIDPTFAKLRAHPRFVDALRSAGLTEVLARVARSPTASTAARH